MHHISALLQLSFLILNWKWLLFTKLQILCSLTSMFIRSSSGKKNYSLLLRWIEFGKIYKHYYNLNCIYHPILSLRMQLQNTTQFRDMKLRKQLQRFLHWSLIGWSVIARKGSNQYSLKPYFPNLCAQRELLPLRLDSYQTLLDYNDTKTNPSALRHPLVAQPQKESFLETYLLWSDGKSPGKPCLLKMGEPAC